ncbi:hypothetical protein [Hymenobacter siberiensis]|uniref:hypothetical protein n=1 Tax=Hymenobacter siberiensis TaxID=2848396 RepID=UPI001C1E489D|nr:hypothetical protein [Hymenobacter siberiensis]MBU6120110.1 hypothetical protein [Hymenobacter siberiensis]
MRTIAKPTALWHLLLLLLLAGVGQARAQAAGTTDVILCADGSEVPGRVLTISPLALTYLPPAGTDTLRLATADVFLVRYANGTREVLHPAPATEKPLTSDLLPGLSDAQRRTKGRQDAARSYTSGGPFWGSLAATLYGGLFLGVMAPAIMAPHAIAAANLKAPDPGLLADPAYSHAYREEAQHRKRGRAWGGYSVGAGLWIVLLGSLVAGNL